MEDTRIIDLYWERDQQAIVETDLKYGKYLKKISWNVLQDEEDSKECVNDTFWKAWNSMPDERPGILSAFLAAIVRNLSLDVYRKKHSNKRGNGQTPVVYEELEEIIGKNSPESDIEVKELKESLNRFLGELDQEHRLIFVRRYWYLDSVHDIAEKLAVSEGKVKTSLFRTRKKLKMYLQAEGYEI